MSEKVTVQGKEGAEFFYTLDRVLAGLLSALEQGRIDEAADLYMRCREDIGFQLISKAQGNPVLFRRVANLFYNARDYARAAYCCEQLEEPDKAAALYERAGDVAQAAQMYAAAGDRNKAAEMFEKGGNLGEAAKLHKLAGQTLRAAICFEKAGRVFDAAQAYQEAGKPEKALQLYQSIDEDSPDRKAALRLAREVMAQGNMQRAPTGQMAVVSDVDVKAGIAVGGGEVAQDGRNVITMMEGFDFLKRLPLFEELSLEDLKSLYHLCELRPFSFGEALIRAGQPAPALFILVEGVLDVRSAATAKAAPGTVARLQPGAHLGELGLIDDSPSNVDVVAAAPGRVLRLDKVGLQRALAASDALAVKIFRVFLRTMAARLRETTARLGPVGA